MRFLEWCFSAQHLVLCLVLVLIDDPSILIAPIHSKTPHAKWRSYYDQLCSVSATTTDNRYFVDYLCTLGLTFAS